MDLALTIFRIGVGVGALLVGIGILVAVLALRPVLRDGRALARDVRRLTQLAESELPELLDQARSVTANAEVLTEDLAVTIEQLRAADDEARPGRAPVGPVQSAHAGEDEQIA